MIIQRFQRDLHRAAKGLAPVIVTGPGFKRCSRPDAGAKPFWRMLPAFCNDFRNAVAMLNGESRDESLLMVAEMLLAEGIVMAEWVTHSATPHDERWVLSVEELAGQVPLAYHSPDDLAGDFLELLDGMSGPEHYRNLFGAHGDAELEPQLVVV